MNKARLVKRQSQGQGYYSMVYLAGPYRDLVMSAFGTDELPTPYLTDADPQMVMDEISRRHQDVGGIHWLQKGDI